MKDPTSQAYDDGVGLKYSYDSDSPECRLKDPDAIELYILEDWDGSDGTANRPNGFIVRSKELADEWIKNKTGTSYRKISGVVVSRLEDIPKAEEVLARQKALEKLTLKEQKLLGLT